MKAINTNIPSPSWRLVWADEFDADQLDPKNWNRQVEKAGRFNEEWQRYTDSEENAYIENNYLVLKAIHESDMHGLGQYTSARLNTANKQSWKYGKIEARIKLPYGQGIWPAFWMLGHDIDENGGSTPWPQCGEIDIMELWGSTSDAEVECNLHFPDIDGEHAMMGARRYQLEQAVFADDFHVFSLEWGAQRIAWSVDGYEYAAVRIDADKYSTFHQPFFILLNIAVGGKDAGRPDASTEFPQYMYVDWIRVYERIKN